MDRIEPVAPLVNVPDSPKPGPSREEAEAAVETLLRWIGEDPGREGLLETPARVARTFLEMFSGYGENPADYLGRTFEEVGGYEDMVLVTDIPFHSHCEHHMVPVHGKAHLAYLPSGRVVGLSKIARVVDLFARRLQTQENMTAQIADTVFDGLAPRGVAVMIEAEHMCMVMRGVRKEGSRTWTTAYRGDFDVDERARREFTDLVLRPR